MLKIALPNKGGLADDARCLTGEAGYQCRRSARELAVRDTENGVEFIFLRPRDIPVYVSNGTIDLGITGRDLARESETGVVELLALGFGRSTFRYAVPVDSGLTPDTLRDVRIATSYPALVRADMAKRGVTCEVICLDGAVEVSVRLGVADAIADVVQTGRTLREAGLKLVGEPILASEAVVIGRQAPQTDEDGAHAFLERLRGIVVAREYVMVEYDVPARLLDEACEITPGIESPTVAPLNEPEWKAVKSMARKRDVNRMMDRLATLGARGIIITDIRTCRL